jgi:DNA topoisomerase 2-associated protein PAT1
MPQLNQQAGVHRQALTRKQALVAIEGLYDQILELEQARMQMPPPDDIPRLEAWNMACLTKSDEIWRRLMVMEPLDVRYVSFNHSVPRLMSSQPHPFVSLLNPIKGQKLFSRLQRHLQPQQAITLLTLLTATYPQLDVVARAPPPPVADASILSKVERKERAKREAETDNFLLYVLPGLDRIITEQCGLGLINGLFGICFQRMEVWRVASTRVSYQPHDGGWEADM